MLFMNHISCSNPEVFTSCLNVENLQVLPKDEIRKLRGGKIRGERVFLAIKRSSATVEVYICQVRNNMRSQDQVFSEGYIFLKSASGKLLQYDIANGTTRVQRYELSSGQEWRRGYGTREAWIL